jgi:hypothetical protein
MHTDPHPSRMGGLSVQISTAQHFSETAQEVRSTRDELMQEFPRAAF